MSSSLLSIVCELWGVVAVVPTIGRISKSVFRHMRHEHRISGDVLATVFLAGTLAGGFLFTLVLGGEFLVLVRWLAVKPESHSKEGSGYSSSVRSGNPSVSSNRSSLNSWSGSMG